MLLFVCLLIAQAAIIQPGMGENDGSSKDVLLTDDMNKNLVQVKEDISAIIITPVS